MSFILEALKKSEKNRQKTSAPNLATQHQSSQKTATTRPRWLILIAVVVLFFNGLVLIWLFAPWQQEKIQPQEQALSTSIHMSAETSAVPQPMATRETQPSDTKQQPAAVVAVAPDVPHAVATVTVQPIVIEPQQPTVVTVAPATPHAVATVATQPIAIEPQHPTVVTVAPDVPHAVATVATQPIAIEPQHPTVVTVAPATPHAVTTVATQPIASIQQQPAVVAVTSAPEPEQQRAVSIRELPAHIQQQLPLFIMSVHGYAGDQSSLIRLNNKIMRQGSTLDGRYRLEEITADGAILSYQGYQFKISRTGH